MHIVNVIVLSAICGADAAIMDSARGIDTILSRSWGLASVGCISTASPRHPQTRAMLRVAGASPCFVALRASGAVASGARCGDTIPELREAVSWHWQGEALVILGARGRVLLAFQPVGPNHWRAERASAPVIDLYLMVPEAKPSQT